MSPIEIHLLLSSYASLIERAVKYAFRTLANLSKLPDEAVEGLKILLKGGTAINNLEDAFEIIRTRPHGHVAAVLGTLRKLELEQLIDSQSSRERDASCCHDSLITWNGICGTL